MADNDGESVEADNEQPPNQQGGKRSEDNR
jgi:hypothetical protein